MTERRAPRAAATIVTRDVLRAKFLDNRPYLKLAFTSPYNLALFFGALAAAGLTFNPFLAVAAVGLEALWLLWAPDSKRLRHDLWDPRFERIKEAMIEQERSQRMALLSERELYRVKDLIGKHKEIRRLAEINPSFTGELLRNELVKTDRLVEAFLDMAVTCGRYEEHLDTVDLDQLDRERARWERAADAGDKDDPNVSIARKNLAVILKRFEKAREIRRYLTLARGQLDLLENSFQLIADQIVTMQSPRELSGQLDELIDGVESIRQTALDTDKILSTIGVEA
ncbi:MAG: hypothetical protein JXO72_14080 [Vicinamibacteria bacterium]|nr:hypothetical protein [Vicinamibacteria bacterium]